MELAALFFVCMAEALYGHMASMPVSELEEPLFDKARERHVRRGYCAGLQPCSNGTMLTP